MVLFLTIILILNPVYGQWEPESPCPDIFHYSRERNEIIGIVEATQSQRYPRLLTLEVQMIIATLLRQGSYVGRIDIGEADYIISENIRRHRPIVFKVYFPLRNYIPAIERILFNGQQICTARTNNRFGTHTTLTLTYEYITNVVDATNIEIKTHSPPFVKIPDVELMTRSPFNSINDDFKCGEKPSNLIPLIYGGDTIDKGDWPWLAAIYFRNRSMNIDAPQIVTYHFICAGSIISESSVITAAHCMFPFKGNRTDPANLFVLFGAYNLNDWGEENIVTSSVSNFRIRDDFNKDSTLRHDIAILILGKRLKFNKFIRPVCLWSGNDDQELVIGRRGLMVGWGQNEKDQLLLDAPRMVRMPIVTTQACKADDQRFHKYTSEFTLCAGAKDGKGPCRGDSGGGLYVENNGTWYIRGIVSLALPGTEFTCDLKHYVVFTDTAKYTSWINQIS